LASNRSAPGVKIAADAAVSGPRTWTPATLSVLVITGMLRFSCGSSHHRGVSSIVTEVGSIEIANYINNSYWFY
jgi:hypothetical protein